MNLFFIIYIENFIKIHVFEFFKLLYKYIGNKLKTFKTFRTFVTSNLHIFYGNEQQL